MPSYSSFITGRTGEDCRAHPVHQGDDHVRSAGRTVIQPLSKGAHWCVLVNVSSLAPSPMRSCHGVSDFRRSRPVCTFMCGVGEWRDGGTCRAASCNICVVCVYPKNVHQPWPLALKVLHRCSRRMATSAKTKPQAQEARQQAPQIGPGPRVRRFRTMAFGRVSLLYPRVSRPG